MTTKISNGVKKIKDWFKNNRQIRIFTFLGVLSISIAIVILSINVFYYIRNPQYTSDPIVYNLVMKQLGLCFFLFILGIIFLSINKLLTHIKNKEKKELQWWNKKIPLKITIVILIILSISAFFIGRFFVKEYVKIWDDLILDVGKNILD